MKRFRIIVPASSANLGPGFDCVGLALNVHLVLDVSMYPEESGSGVPTLRYDPPMPTLSTAPEHNLILQSAFHLVHRHQLGAALADEYDPVALPCRVDIVAKNDIPLAKGMGSSSAAIVAGMMLANEVCGYGMSRDALLAYIVEKEGHVDNVAAAVMGGLVLAGSMLPDAQNTPNNPPAAVQTLSYPWNGGFRLMLLLPSHSVSTKVARGLLPPTYRPDEVLFNLSRVGFVMSILSGNAKFSGQAPWTASKSASMDANAAATDDINRIAILRTVLCDRIHQPYRYTTVPHLPVLMQKFAGLALDFAMGSRVVEQIGVSEVQAHPDVAGMVLSGAGPALLVFLRGSVLDAEAAVIGDQMVAEMTRSGVTNGRWQLVDVDHQGARIEYS